MIAKLHFNQQVKDVRILLFFQPPRAMAILPVPSTAPCVNVPDWFIKEGGELCISESRLGFSTLRYWPHFLTEIGNEVP